MNDGYQIPYIPLSWLRQKRVEVEHLYRCKTIITSYDVWLWLVRQEIDRLIIEDLRTKISEQEKIIEQYRKMTVAILMEV